MSQSKLIGKITGAGTSGSLINGHQTAAHQYDRFLSIEQEKGNLLDRKSLFDLTFKLDDLRLIAKDETFEQFAYYLVETAKSNILAEILANTEAIDEHFGLDENTGDFKATGTIKQYLSNFQNKIVSMDRNKEIEYFDKFREQHIKGSSPVFISKIRREIEKLMMRFLIEKGIPSKFKIVGISKENLATIIKHMLEGDIVLVL